MIIYKANNESKSSSSLTNKSPSPESPNRSPNYLQLPRIDFRPEYYQPKPPSVRFRDQTTSAHSVFVKEATEPIKKTEQKPTESPTSLMFQNQQSLLAQLREKDQNQYQKCLEKTKNLFDSDLTLKRGYLNPIDANKQEILAELKRKEELKKEKVSNKANEKPRSKNKNKSKKS